jgi:hypothetical protein
MPITLEMLLLEKPTKIAKGLTKKDDITTTDIERSSSVLSSATSTSSSSPTLVSKAKNPRKRSAAAQDFRKNMAEKELKRRKERHKQSDKVANAIASSHEGSEKLVRSLIEGLSEANRSEVHVAIATFEKELAAEYDQRRIFKIYDILEDEAKAIAFITMAEIRRGPWLEYELEKHGLGT